MRELGFSVLWPKLAKPTATTFRFKRKDADWNEGEMVKVVYKPRSKKDRSVMGIAEIVRRDWRWAIDRSMVTVVDDTSVVEYRNALIVTDDEAKIDGFKDHKEMAEWMSKTYKGRNYQEPMSKLTIRWQQRWFNLEQKPHIAKQWIELLEDTLKCQKV